VDAYVVAMRRFLRSAEWVSGENKGERSAQICDAVRHGDGRLDHGAPFHARLGCAYINSFWKSVLQRSLCPL